MGVGRGKRRRLSDGYRFEGFRAQEGKVRGVFGGISARILPLERRSKKLFAENVAQYTADGMTVRLSWYETCLAETCMYTWRLNTGVWIVGFAVK